MLVEMIKKERTEIKKICIKISDKYRKYYQKNKEMISSKLN